MAAARPVGRWAAGPFVMAASSYNRLTARGGTSSFSCEDVSTGRLKSVLLHLSRGPAPTSVTVSRRSRLNVGAVAALSHSTNNSVPARFHAELLAVITFPVISAALDTLYFLSPLVGGHLSRLLACAGYRPGR